MVDAVKSLIGQDNIRLTSASPRPIPAGMLIDDAIAQTPSSDQPVTVIQGIAVKYNN